MDTGSMHGRFFIIDASVTRVAYTIFSQSLLSTLVNSSVFNIIAAFARAHHVLHLRHDHYEKQLALSISLILSAIESTP